jgi:FPC/CPF motif-containing protein YcgG
LIVAAGINALMDQGRQDSGESESLRSLKSELEQYRKVQGDKANREDLLRIWKTYEGKLNAEEIERLKRDYRAKLDPAEVEALQKAYEDMKGRKP